MELVHCHLVKDQWRSSGQLARRASLSFTDEKRWPHPLEVVACVRVLVAGEGLEEAWRAWYMYSDFGRRRGYVDTSIC